MNYENYRFTRGLFPLSDYTSLILAVIGYLVVVGWLKEYMKQRKKFELKWIVFAHNLFLCVASLVMLLGVVYEMFFIMKEANSFSDLANTLLCDPNRRIAIGGQVVWFQLFYYSKYYEFLDTVIILLKQRPLIFLHVYHHFITAVLTFVMLDNEVPVQWIAITANASVHVPMYFYYAMSVIGYSPWWKKYMTVFQIIQFIVDISANSVGFYYHYTTNYSCSGSIESWWFGQAVLVSFLLLFINFYSKTYTSQKQKSQ
eukprot:TRINITY_DN18574_c0_g1_i1.p1 TRINITY_DN18574_c0_g1~~TRINITY_DN18574_c0_g1_i1.p1  ORF type:complete len:257 (+),score=41.46 TRINITY_DN18574_c0_g1_i1:28-798(+)